jgi:hypothetical protein
MSREFAYNPRTTALCLKGAGQICATSLAQDRALEEVELVDSDPSDACIVPGSGAGVARQGLIGGVRVWNSEARGMGALL